MSLKIIISVLQNVSRKRTRLACGCCIKFILNLVPGIWGTKSRLRILFYMIEYINIFKGAMK